MAANALFNFPASLRLCTSLPSLPHLLCVCACVCIYWLFAQNYEIISTWVQLPQAHTHTQTATYCNALHTHTHIHTQTQPCGWIACCTSIFKFCCFIISWRIACNLSLSSSLALSPSLYDWFLGFYVLGVGIIIISSLATLGNLWPLALENIGFSFSLLLFPPSPSTLSNSIFGCLIALMCFPIVCSLFPLSVCASQHDGPTCCNLFGARMRHIIYKISLDPASDMGAPHICQKSPR